VCLSLNAFLGPPILWNVAGFGGMVSQVTTGMDILDQEGATGIIIETVIIATAIRKHTSAHTMARMPIYLAATHSIHSLANLPHSFTPSLHI